MGTTEPGAYPLVLATYNIVCSRATTPTPPARSGPS